MCPKLKHAKLAFILLLIFIIAPIMETNEVCEVCQVWAQEASVVMIIAQKNFRDEELFETKAILESEGVEVIVASTTFKPIKGMLGGVVEANIHVDDINVDFHDAIIFIGGHGAKQYWNDEKAHTIAQEAVDKGRILGAICVAPVTLANAGVLNGKNATVFAAYNMELSNGGATYTGAPVEVDGNIITGNGPKASKEFAKQLLEMIWSGYE